MSRVLTPQTAEAIGAAFAVRDELHRRRNGPPLLLAANEETEPASSRLQVLGGHARALRAQVGRATAEPDAITQAAILIAVAVGLDTLAAELETFG